MKRFARPWTRWNIVAAMAMAAMARSSVSRKLHWVRFLFNRMLRTCHLLTLVKSMFRLWGSRGFRRWEWTERQRLQWWQRKRRTIWTGRQEGRSRWITWIIVATCISEIKQFMSVSLAGENAFRTSKKAGLCKTYVHGWPTVPRTPLRSSIVFFILGI